jgi:prepilin-type N-terminal cleavage/methylation domain-containing protein
MTATEENPTDSEAYSQGVAAGQSPEYVPCPYEASSRAAQMWYEGRQDILHASDKKRIREAFTLPELLIVMGIIVLMIAIAVPVVRSLMGSSSISMARNTLSSLLARAREEAIGMQQVRGVMFMVDKTTNRLIGIMVQEAVVQDPNQPTIIMLDSIPNRDSVPLPSGVRMQTVFNGVSAANSAAGTDDHYLGFNPPYGQPQLFLGGAILFDGNGKLISRPYGFQLSQPFTTGYTASNLCTFLGVDYSGVQTYADLQNPMTGSYAFVPGFTGIISGNSRTPPATLVCSQVALILFDYDAFKAMGFTDQDADLSSAQTYTAPWPINTTSDGDGVHSEKDEETWLDNNSTPLMINRYDGTLIRAE